MFTLAKGAIAFQTGFTYVILKLPLVDPFNCEHLTILSVLLDEILRWRSHIVKLFQEATHVSWHISQIKAPCSSRYTYFYSLRFVLSLLDICSWSCCLGCNIRKPSETCPYCTEKSQGYNYL